MAQQQKINTVVMILMITMTMHYGGVMAQFLECASVITSMPEECSSFIGNPTPTASSSCCTEFKSVMQSQEQCLCQLFNSTTPFPGLSELVIVCNVDKPSECNNGTNKTSPSANSPPPSDATSTRYTNFPILCLLLAAAYAIVF